MWEDMNREFAGAVITRAQAWRTPQQEAEWPNEALNMEMPMTSTLDGVQSAAGAESDAGNENTPDGDAAMLTSSMDRDLKTDGTRVVGDWVDQDSRSVQVNSEFHFDDALFAEPGRERMHHTRAEKRQEWQR